MNILGIDFEEWYHPELIQKSITDIKLEPKVSKGLDKIIDLLRKNDTKATFFVVGELLEIFPTMVDKIIENEHEIAFHTMHHHRLEKMFDKQELDEEIKKFAELTNNRSVGFRAPTFSLNSNTSWLIDVLEENNYVYDSSIVPCKTSMYGVPNAEKNPYKIMSSDIETDNHDGKIIEFPLAVTNFLGKTIPACGGFYLRFLPFSVIKNTVKNYEKQKIPATFYIHSWELTPEFMPKIKLPVKDNFITYHNLNKAYGRIDKLLKEFKFTSFSDYIHQ